MRAFTVRREPPPPYRIAFAGASGTGKTTLMNAVNETLQLPICPVGSRSVAEEMGFASPYDVDKAGRREEFQLRLFTLKRAWEEKHPDGFLTDRTHYDNLAYSAMHCPSVLSTELLAQVQHASLFYTDIIVCSVETFWRVGDDPARVKDRGYHEIFDVLLQGLVARYGKLQLDEGRDAAKLLADYGWKAPTAKEGTP